MIYLLSGLLIIHGLVCLLGAFFPLYPPVYFFYAFFPGHFAIRLIIVLLVGAFQVVYGVYLLLRRRWQIRWHWLALAIVVFTGLLLILPAYHGLFTKAYDGGEANPIPSIEPPPYPSARPGPERPDDIIQTPGGLAYRANVHQEGVENPWPPIDSQEVILADNVYSPQIVYRDYIETESGASRNNIIYVNAGGREINKLELYTTDVPTGIEVKRGMLWQGPGNMAQVLVIEIAQDVRPAEYTFKIGVKIDGTDCGAVPCMINVVEDSLEDSYPDNHGITTTRVEPKPGENVTMSSGLMVRLTLDDLIKKSDTIVTGRVVDIFPSRFEPVTMVSSYMTVFTDVIIETERYLYGEPQSKYIAVRVMGGRVDEMTMWVEDEPVFNLGEEVMLFLTRAAELSVPPEGIDFEDYYRVTGAMQGKLGYMNSSLVTPEGERLSVSELEQRVATIRGVE
jgi:hypothetical protein